MKTRGRILLLVLALYVAGLAWGYVRLPLAAFKGMSIYPGIASPLPITFDDRHDISPAQQWYLDRSLTESPVPVVPRVSADVKWNALVLARVRSNYYFSGKGSKDILEHHDSLYVNVFGAWISVHSFASEIS